MTTDNTQEDTGKTQAIAQVASIVEMVAALAVDYDRLEELREDFNAWQDETAAEAFVDADELAELEAAAGDCESEEEARERIDQDPLSVEVRSDWVSPGEPMEAGEFRIVLCTGGPHVELVGDLDQYGQPSQVRVLYKDWGTSGELFDFDRDAVLTYCQQFFFE